jgi:hypothetical protein
MTYCILCAPETLFPPRGWGLGTRLKLGGRLSPDINAHAYYLGEASPGEFPIVDHGSQAVHWSSGSGMIRMEERITLER